MKGCEDCAAAEAVGVFSTCSFHRVDHIDFDDCDRHPLKTVRLVQVPADDTDW